MFASKYFRYLFMQIVKKVWWVDVLIKQTPDLSAAQGVKKCVWQSRGSVDEKSPPRWVAALPLWLHTICK